MRLLLSVIFLLVAPLCAASSYVPSDDGVVVPPSDSPAVPPPLPDPEQPVPADELLRKSEREAKEKDHRSAVEKAAVAYAECLSSENSALFGADFEKCKGHGNRLRALYPSATADAALVCLEIGVLKKSLTGTTACPFKTPAKPDTSNEGRWK